MVSSRSPSPLPLQFDPVFGEHYNLGVTSSAQMPCFRIVFVNNANRWVFCPNKNPTGHSANQAPALDTNIPPEMLPNWAEKAYREAGKELAMSEADVEPEPTPEQVLKATRKSARKSPEPVHQRQRSVKHGKRNTPLELETLPIGGNGKALTEEKSLAGKPVEVLTKNSPQSTSAIDQRQQQPLDKVLNDELPTRKRPAK